MIARNASVKGAHYAQAARGHWKFAGNCRNEIRSRQPAVFTCVECHGYLLTILRFSLPLGGSLVVRSLSKVGRGVLTAPVSIGQMRRGPVGTPRPTSRNHAAESSSVSIRELRSQ